MKGTIQHTAPSPALTVDTMPTDGLIVLCNDGNHRPAPNGKGPLYGGHVLYPDDKYRAPGLIRCTDGDYRMPKAAAEFEQAAVEAARLKQQQQQQQQ